MKRLSFSVVIPNYNCGKYLRQTLNSIRAQQCQNLEVIVVDGGSTDNSGDVVNEFRDIVTTYVSEPDRGQLHAVQKGLRLAGGDILLWMNADDIVMPGAFGCVEKTFSENREIDIVYSDNFAFDENALYVGRTIKNLRHDEHVLFYRQMYSECIYWRREITRLTAERFESFRICTDYAFFLNLRRDRAALWAPKRLGAFRMRSDQLSQLNRHRCREEFQAIRTEEFCNLGWRPERVRREQIRRLVPFWVRQIVIPDLKRGMRKLGRLLSGDRQRLRAAKVFHEKWLEGEVLTDDEVGLLEQ